MICKTRTIFDGSSLRSFLRQLTAIPLGTIPYMAQSPQNLEDNPPNRSFMMIGPRRLKQSIDRFFNGVSRRFMELSYYQQVCKPKTRGTNLDQFQRDGQCSIHDFGVLVSKAPEHFGCYSSKKVWFIARKGRACEQGASTDMGPTMSLFKEIYPGIHTDEGLDRRS
jgi:hypothetical protein